MTPSPNAPVQTTIGPLDQTLWTDEWDASINPVQATAYGHIQTPSGLILQMRSNVPFGGWLCKNSQPLPVKAQNITFAYTITVDDATPVCAQVIETDAKFTDDAGWLYDGSFQINIAKGWMLQIGAPWHDTGVKIDPLMPGVATRTAVNFVLDYAAHTITVASVNVGAKSYPIGITAPAKQTTWAKMRIISQGQQCNNAQPGGYTLKLSTITYQLS